LKNNLTILVILLASIAFFILGLTYPILSTKKQVFGLVLKYQEIRLFDSIRMFYDSREYLMATIILLFTIVFPVVKFLEIMNRIVSVLNIPEKTNYILHLLDKWSMLDVFLIALLLLNFKMNSNIIVMQLKVGTVFIAVSIITRMLTTMLIDFKNREL
jgi:paraquat-inducible protein A